MITQELIQYVKSEIAKGVNRDVIFSKLKTQGWTDSDIIEVFDIIMSTQNENTTEVSYDVSPVEQNIKKNYMKIGLFIIIPIILILGGFVVYASGYFITPSKLFSNWINLSKENTSLSFDFNLNIDASQIKFDNIIESSEMYKYKDINFNMKGDSDYSDLNNVKFNSSLSLKAADVEAGINLKMKNESFYISLSKAPNIGFFSLKPFENKWVVVPIKDHSGGFAGNPLLSMLPVDADLFSNITDEQNKKVEEIIKKASFVKITKRHLPSIIDGSLFYHFEYDLDRDGIVSFMKEMAIYLDELNHGDIKTNDIANDDYNKIFTYIKNFKGEAWIGIFNKLPYKMTMDMEVVNPEKQDGGVAKVELSVIYTNWNKPVLFEIPTNTITIEDLISQATSGMFGSGDSIKIEAIQ